MSQLVERFSQPEMGGANFFLRRLEAERLQEYGWQEPYESRGSRTVRRGTGGEIPPVYPTVYGIVKPILKVVISETYITSFRGCTHCHWLKLDTIIKILRFQIS